MTGAKTWSLDITKQDIE